MHDLFQERVLNSPAVCRNCYRTVRVERVRAETGRFDSAHESSRYARERRNTSIEFAPAETASDSKGVFCECGVESAFDRVWDDADVDRERFRAFIKAVLRSLERQGIALDRHRAAARALQAWDDDATVDEALSAGVAQGLAVAQTHDGPSQVPVR